MDHMTSKTQYTDIDVSGTNKPVILVKDSTPHNRTYGKFTVHRGTRVEHRADTDGFFFEKLCRDPFFIFFLKNELSEKVVVFVETKYVVSRM